LILLLTVTASLLYNASALGWWKNSS